MRLVIRVAAGTLQRAFTSDFYRKRRLLAPKDLAPCLNHLIGVHRLQPFLRRAQSIRLVRPGLVRGLAEDSWGTDSPQESHGSSKVLRRLGEVGLRKTGERHG